MPDTNRLRSNTSSVTVIKATPRMMAESTAPTVRTTPYTFANLSMKEGRTGSVIGEKRAQFLDLCRRRLFKFGPICVARHLLPFDLVVAREGDGLDTLLVLPLDLALHISWVVLALIRFHFERGIGQNFFLRSGQRVPFRQIDQERNLHGIEPRFDAIFGL